MKETNQVYRKNKKERKCQTNHSGKGHAHHHPCSFLYAVLPAGIISLQCTTHFKNEIESTLLTASIALA